MNEEKYATRAARCKAMIIDYNIVSLFIYIIYDIIYRDCSMGTFFFVVVVLFWIGFCAPHLYMIIAHARFRTTIGKSVYGLRLENRKTEGLISAKKSVVRELFPLIVLTSVILYFSRQHILGQSIVRIVSIKFVLLPVVTERLILFAVETVWWSIELLTMLFTAKHISLQDLIANSVVVKKSAQSSRSLWYFWGSFILKYGCILMIVAVHQLY